MRPQQIGYSHRMHWVDPVKANTVSSNVTLRNEEPALKGVMGRPIRSAWS